MRLMQILAALSAALLLTGCGHERAAGDVAEHEPIEAELTEVRLLEEARPIEVQGVVQAAQESFLSSRAMGPVVQVRVNAGDRVTEGEVLLEIQQDMSHGQLAQARGARAQAEAAISLARRHYERFKRLYEKEACSELELDMARMQFEQARGAVEQAEGAVEAASSVAEESRLRAPFEALVVEKLVNPGDLAAPGRPLVRLQSLTGRRLWLTVREADIVHLRTGMVLPVSIDSRPDLGTIEGRVAEIAPAADMATHTFAVKVELDIDDLAPGITGRATVPGETRSRMLVPVDAVYRAGCAWLRLWMRGARRAPGP